MPATEIAPQTGYAEPRRRNWLEPPGPPTDAERIQAAWRISNGGVCSVLNEDPEGGDEIYVDAASIDGDGHQITTESNVVGGSWGRCAK